MNLLKRLFKRPITICMLTVVCLVFGVIATMNMSTNLLPNISFPALGISVAYPGASAEKCDEDVRPIMENSLKTISQVKSIGSFSIEHASIMTVMFDYGVDLDEKISEIKDKFSLLVFPSGCTEPIFTQVDFNGMAVATVAVKNDAGAEMSYEDADELKNRILAVNDVASVTVVGKPETYMEITPINGLEITTLLIAQALTSDSQLDIPLGSLEENGETVAFRNESSAQTIEDIKATPIQMPVPMALGEALSTLKQVMDYAETVTSLEMQKTRDDLWRYYELINKIEVITGEQLLNSIESILPLDKIVSFFNRIKLNDVATATEILINYLRQNPDVLSPTAKTIKDLQNSLAEAFPEERWAQFDAVIEFKKSKEYQNPITGEIIPDEILPSDYVQLISTLGLSLPMTITPELIEFVENRDLTSLEYDANGNANLNLYIGDVATVTEKTSYDTKAYLDGGESVTLLVYGISGSNSTEISEGVKEVINDSASLPHGSSAVLLDDQSQFINDSISNVLQSMLIGGVLAILVIFLFLFKLRTSLIIAITMPLSVLCSLICLYAMNVTLNMVSLGGMAVGIGMLVDNSIVVIESITFERDKGKTAMQAAVDGTKLVASSLLASTLTSICVFFPILFTEGLTKMIFSDMSWSVIFSLSFSLIVAVTVIPTLYCTVYRDTRLLSGKPLKQTVNTNTATKAEKTPSKTAKVADNVQKLNFMPKVLSSLMNRYEGFLNLVLKRRWLVLLVAFVLFAGSIGLVFVTGTEFLPSVDQRTIEVKVAFGASDNLEYAEQTTLKLYDDIIANLDNAQNVSMTVGKIALTDTANVGTIRVLLKETGKSTDEVAHEIRTLAEKNQITATVTEVDGVLASLMSSVGGISNISVNVTGDSIETLKEISNKVREKTLASNDYFTNVRDNLTEKSLEYVISIDKMKCLEYGIDYTVAIATLRAGISGFTACSAEFNGNVVNVNVKFKEGAIEDYYGGIENFMLGMSDGKAVTVGDVAEITPHYSYSLIKKENGKNLATISVDYADVDSGTASKQFTKIVKEVLADYEGYSFIESGVNSYLSEVFDGLIIALIVSFFLLFAVMACQFESLAKPFIVIFAIPFSFTGGFLALAITGITLNVVSFVGLIMLMGVIINDAIVMVDRIGQFEAEGMPKYRALIEGSKSRMRAIWMTTLTTVLALIPLALAIGKGAELMQPLAVVVIGGLTLGTLVTLILIPVMYSLVKRVKPDKNDEPTPDQVDESSNDPETEPEQTTVNEETENTSSLETNTSEDSVEESTPAQQLEASVEESTPTQQLEDSVEDSTPTQQLEASVEESTPAQQLEDSVEDSTPTQQLEASEPLVKTELPLTEVDLDNNSGQKTTDDGLPLTEIKLDK